MAEAANTFLVKAYEIERIELYKMTCHHQAWNYTGGGKYHWSGPLEIRRLYSQTNWTIYV